MNTLGRRALYGGVMAALLAGACSSANSAPTAASARPSSNDSAGGSNGAAKTPKQKAIESTPLTSTTFKSRRDNSHISGVGQLDQSWGDPSEVVYNVSILL